MRSVFLPSLLVLVMGCGSQRPESEVERGRAAVSAALESWKKREPFARLKSLADPVEFVEELSATHTLSSYTFGKVDTSDQNVIRYAVTLNLKDRKGKVLDREVVYAVALKSPVTVSRDPYY